MKGVASSFSVSPLAIPLSSPASRRSKHVERPLPKVGPHCASSSLTAPPPSPAFSSDVSVASTSLSASSSRSAASDSAARLQLSSFLSSSYSSHSPSSASLDLSPSPASLLAREPSPPGASSVSASAPASSSASSSQASPFASSTSSECSSCRPELSGDDVSRRSPCASGAASYPPASPLRRRCSLWTVAPPARRAAEPSRAGDKKAILPSKSRLFRGPTRSLSAEYRAQADFAEDLRRDFASRGQRETPSGALSTPVDFCGAAALVVASGLSTNSHKRKPNLGASAIVNSASSFLPYPVGSPPPSSGPLPIPPLRASASVSTSAVPRSLSHSSFPSPASAGPAVGEEPVPGASAEAAAATRRRLRSLQRAEVRKGTPQHTREERRASRDPPLDTFFPCRRSARETAKGDCGLGPLAAPDGILGESGTVEVSSRSVVGCQRETSPSVSSAVVSSPVSCLSLCEVDSSVLSSSLDPVKGLQPSAENALCPECRVVCCDCCRPSAPAIVEGPAASSSPSSPSPASSPRAVISFISPSPPFPRRRVLRHPATLSSSLFSSQPSSASPPAAPQLPFTSAAVSQPSGSPRSSAFSFSPPPSSPVSSPPFASGAAFSSASAPASSSPASVSRASAAFCAPPSPLGCAVFPPSPPPPPPRRTMGCRCSTQQKLRRPRTAPKGDGASPDRLERGEAAGAGAAELPLVATPATETVGGTPRGDEKRLSSPSVADGAGPSRGHASLAGGGGSEQENLREKRREAEGTLSEKEREGDDEPENSGRGASVDASAPGRPVERQKREREAEETAHEEDGAEAHPRDVSFLSTGAKSARGGCAASARHDDGGGDLRAGAADGEQEEEGTMSAVGAVGSGACEARGRRKRRGDDGEETTHVPGRISSADDADPKNSTQAYASSFLASTATSASTTEEVKAISAPVVPSSCLSSAGARQLENASPAGPPSGHVSSRAPLGSPGGLSREVYVPGDSASTQAAASAIPSPCKRRVNSQQNASDGAGTFWLPAEAQRGQGVGDGSRSLVRRRVGSASPSSAEYREEARQNSSSSSSSSLSTADGASAASASRAAGSRRLSSSMSPSGSRRKRRGAGRSKKVAAGGDDGDMLCSLSPLAYSQRQLLPSHLNRSLTVSEILLESSIVGRYVMLPWNEDDGDIRQNFYVNSPPPCAALPCPPLSRPVATHACVPPLSPAASSALLSNSFVHPASGAPREACASDRRRLAGGGAEEKGARERDELQGWGYSLPVMAPDRLVRSTQRDVADNGEFRGFAAGNLAKTDGNVDRCQAWREGKGTALDSSSSMLGAGQEARRREETNGKARQHRKRGPCALPAGVVADPTACGLGSPFGLAGDGEEPFAAVRAEEWGPDGKWTDPDGVMSLSRKQQQKFAAWKRLSEIVKDPVVIQDLPNSRAIRQGFVGDCSFLSSLAVLSEFERKHKVPVLSGLLYPQGVIPSPCDQEGEAGGGRRGRASSPIFNPRGMYACRLYFNGVPRKVLIDDFVPVRKDNKLLAAHSSNKSELWVTLLEKAFVKLMGGSYSMQGSNPGADLYHLTGWIPETIPFRSDVHTGSPASHKPIITGRENEDDEVVRDPKWAQIWEQLYLGLTAGRCVACLGTSEVSDAAPSGLDFPEGVSVSSGIVARHAYSILRYAEIEGHRLLYVKNPWGCVRWKGRFSPSDPDSWTQNMKEQLEYDPVAAAHADCGCFWIEWLDVVRWFSHLYVCWDGSCFPYQAEIHSKWERSPFIEDSSLADDSHLVAFNPQFHLRIASRPEDFCPSSSAPPYPFLSFPSLTSPATASPGPCPASPSADVGRDASFPSSPCSLASMGCGDHPVELWILLSRHVRERQKDLASKYLAIHLHAASERATCPPPPVKQGVYSNGECTLVKLRVHPHVFRELRKDSAEEKTPPALPGYEGHNLLDASEYVLVVSQYSQKDEFNFTIKVYGHVNSSLTQLPPLLPPDAQSVYFKGNWGPSTSGGCSNDLWRYFTNPHIRLKVPEPCDAIFFLESPQEHSVNLRLFKNRVATARLLRTGKALSTGPYRAGCCMLKTRLEATTYTIIPSTFRPDDTDTFQLSLHVPGHVKKPVPLLLPQPYAIPPPASHFYRVIDGRKCTHQVWSRVAIQVQRPALVSLRLQLTSPPEPGDAFPSLTVYRYTEFAEESSREGERGRDEKKAQKKLQFIIRSDLDGGLSEDGHTASSAAQDLFHRQGVVNVSLVELHDPLTPYVIFISTLNGEKGESGAATHTHSRDAAIHHLHRQEGRRREEAHARPWKLHVFADIPVDVQLLM